jgi:sec-independent protein translocase protein TatA
MMRIGPFGIWEIVIILVAILLLFGSQRLPELARNFGRSFKEFRKGVKEITGDIEADIKDIKSDIQMEMKDIRSDIALEMKEIRSDMVIDTDEDGREKVSTSKPSVPAVGKADNA